MNSSNLFKYLGYAIGEIVLIVIGINVALYFDNQNREQQIQEELHKVYDVISHDLAIDTTNMNQLITHFENMEPIFNKVLQQQMTKEELDSCSECKYLALMYDNMIFSDRGFKLLNRNPEFNSANSDSLHNKIMSYFDFVKGNIEGIVQNQIRTDADANVENWKTNYDWYFDMNTNPYFVDYALNDKKYLNMVKKHHFLLYNNWLRKMKVAKTQATELLDELNNSKK